MLQTSTPCFQSGRIRTKDDRMFLVSIKMKDEQEDLDCTAESKISFGVRLGGQGSEESLFLLCNLSSFNPYKGKNRLDFDTVLLYSR